METAVWEAIALVLEAWVVIVAETTVMLEAGVTAEVMEAVVQVVFAYEEVLEAKVVVLLKMVLEEEEME